MTETQKKKTEETPLPPQAVSECPVCEFTPVQIKSWVAEKEGRVLHVEFTYKCFGCGWGRSCPEQFL